MRTRSERKHSLSVVQKASLTSATRCGPVGLSLVLLALPAMTSGQAPTPGRTRIGPAAQVETPAAAAQPPRVSVLVHMNPNARRGPVRRYAANRGGWVQYEYDILPNVMNLRGIPVDALRGLARVHGVFRVEEDKEVHAHMNDSIPLIRAAPHVGVLLE